MKNKELEKKLYDTAFKFEENYGGCAQCVVGTIKEVIGKVSEDTFTAATALAGGVAASGNACGACTGGMLAIGSFIGRDFKNFGTEEGFNAKNHATALGIKLVEKFQGEYGSINCSAIQEKIYGKSYKMYIPEEKDEFLASGGHGENGCTMVCAKAAQWVGEILEEENLI